MFPLKSRPLYTNKSHPPILSFFLISFIQTKILTLPLENYYINFCDANPVCLIILKRYYTKI